MTSPVNTNSAARSRPTSARQASEPADVGDEPAQHEQLTELRPLGRDPDVGVHRQLHPPTDGRTVDGGDHRDVGVEERVGGGREPRLTRAQIGRLLAAAHDLFHVVARAERRVGPGDHEAPRRRVAHRCFERGVRRPRQRVARLGPVDREHLDVPVPLGHELGRRLARQLVVMDADSRSTPCRCSDRPTPGPIERAPIHVCVRISVHRSSEILTQTTVGNRTVGAVGTTVGRFDSVRA